MTTDLCISFGLAALCPLIAWSSCLGSRRRTQSAAESLSPAADATRDKDPRPDSDECSPQGAAHRFPTSEDDTCAWLYYAFFCLIQLPLFGERATGTGTVPEGIVGALLNIVVSLAVYLPLLLHAARHRGSGFLNLKSRALPMRQHALIFLLSLAAVFAFSLLYQSCGLHELILSLSGAPELQTVCERIARTTGTGALLLMGINTIIIAPICEEILWRGYFFNILRSRSSTAVAAMTSGLLFGAIHFAVPQFLILSFLGFVLALSYHRSRSLLMPIALHMTFNAINFTLLLV